MVRASVAGGVAKTLGSLGEPGGHVWPQGLAWSGDGSRVLLADGDPPSMTLWACDPATGERTALTGRRWIASVSVDLEAGRAGGPWRCGPGDSEARWRRPAVASAADVERRRTATGSARDGGRPRGLHGGPVWRGRSRRRLGQDASFVPGCGLASGDGRQTGRRAALECGIATLRGGRRVRRFADGPRSFASGAGEVAPASWPRRRCAEGLGRIDLRLRRAARPGARGSGRARRDASLRSEALQRRA